MISCFFFRNSLYTGILYQKVEGRAVGKIKKNFCFKTFLGKPVSLGLDFEKYNENSGGHT